MAQWYCRLMGEELGPLSGAQLMEMARSHQLTPEDYVRKGVDGDWVGAFLVKGLFDAATCTSGTSLLHPAEVPENVAAPAKQPTEDWFCICNHEKLGPMTFEMLQSLAASGRLHPTDRVWTSLVPKHHTAREIKGLSFPASVS